MVRQVFSAALLILLVLMGYAHAQQTAAPISPSVSSSSSAPAASSSSAPSSPTASVQPSAQVPGQIQVINPFAGVSSQASSASQLPGQAPTQTSSIPAQAAPAGMQQSQPLTPQQQQQAQPSSLTTQQQMQQLTTQQQMQILQQLTPDQQQQILQELPPQHKTIAERMTPQQQQQYLQQLTPQQQQQLLQRLTPDQQQQLLQKLPPQQQQTQKITQQQAELLQKITPDQRDAFSRETIRTGGVLTPEVIEALKAKPEFKGLSTDDLMKMKDALDQAEKAKKEQNKLGEKMLISEEKEKSLFERYRFVGRYQDISMALVPFGYQFFLDANVGVSTDRKDVPVPSKYVIGPGDEVRLLLWGRVNAQHNLVVDRDGNITIPQIGPVKVAGKTFEEMSAHLIKQAEQIVGGNIDISMGSLKTIPVFVLGDVRRPGSYTIGSFATITDALLIAGGPNGIGSMRNVQLRRKNKTVTTFDLYDLLLKGDKSKDMILEAGDIVFVPVAGPLVGIAGNVKRPAIYELKGVQNLNTAFRLAGGIVPTAYTQQIQVERIVKNEKQIVVDINDKDLTRTREVELHDGDLVKVFSIVDKDVNALFLEGNVKRPGKYEYKQGMRVKDLIKGPMDLLQETHFEYATIKRRVPPDLNTEVITFNLGRLLFQNDGSQNLELKPNDTVTVFSQWSFKDKPFVTVSGEVRNPDRFELAKKSKVKDLILMAGDVTKEAYLSKGEIVRRNKQREWITVYFNVEKAMNDDPEHNLDIHDEDRIIIHSIWEDRWREVVSVAGEVKKPDEYQLTQDLRVSDLIFKAGGLTRDAYLDEVQLYRTDWRTKKVTLQKLSLKRALAGEKEDNIKLRDLDRLVVHSIWEKEYRKIVSVEGDVLKPGSYEYAENMTVQDLIFASGNVLPSAFLGSAEVSSQIPDENGRGVKMVHRTILLKEALQGDPENNIVLKPYDRLFVKRMAGWRKERYVTISGEIEYPGRYILKDGETLSSLIERAGGYKEQAYLRGAVFTRASVQQLQQRNIEEMANRLQRQLLAESSTTTTSVTTPGEAQARKTELEQRQAFIDSLKTVKATGRMTVSLAHQRLLKGSLYDIPLEDGDSLYIPMNNRVVNVMGAVMTNASLVYGEDTKPKDYVQMAGGYTTYADAKNTYVLKVDGSARKLSGGLISWNGSKDRWEMAGFGTEIKEIESGDTIVVPEKLERTAWLREIKDITQIIAQLATATGVIYLMTK